MSGRRPRTVRLDDEVWLQVQAATVGMQRIDPGYTLAQLVEDAICREVERLQCQHHGGAAFPVSAVTARPGRRVVVGQSRSLTAVEAGGNGDTAVSPQEDR